MMIRTLAAASLCTILSTGSAFADESAQVMGLSFDVPQDWTWVESDRVITLSQTGERRFIASVELHPDTSPLDVAVIEGEIIRQGFSPASFVIYEHAGGSGGLEYTLVTKKQVGRRTVTLLALEQSETGWPEFTEALTIWNSLGAAAE